MIKIEFEKISSTRHVSEPNGHEHHQKRLHRILALIKDGLYANWLAIRYLEPFALLVIATWVYLCVALKIPNPFRALMIWGLVVLLTIGAATVDYLRQKNRNG